MNAQGPPDSSNNFHAQHVEALIRSYCRWTGRHLVDPELPPAACARTIFEAPFAILSHGIGPDPVFNYANATALTLFETSWEQLLRTPSRESAEAMDQASRQALFSRVAQQGYVDDYVGIRVSASGRRFRIQRSTIWQVIEVSGKHLGEAATFDRWVWL